METEDRRGETPKEKQHIFQATTCVMLCGLRFCQRRWPVLTAKAREKFKTLQGCFCACPLTQLLLLLLLRLLLSLLLLLLSSHRDKGIFISLACSVTVAYFVLVPVYLNKGNHGGEGE